LWFHMGVTVTETVFGFLFGAMAGILAGFALARWRRAHVALDPSLMGVYALPRVALAALFIMWFGVGIPAKIILAIYIVFFVVLIVLALLAVGTYNLMSRLEKRLLHWRGDTITV